MVINLQEVNINIPKKEELIKHLTSIASIYSPGAKIVDLDIVPIEKSVLSRKQGNKTDTFKISVKEYKGLSGSEFNLFNLPPTYILKRDKDNVHFNLRKAVLSVSNEFVKPHAYKSFFGAKTRAFPFCYSLGYKPFNEKKLTLSNVVDEKSLDEKVKEYREKNGNGIKLDELDIFKQANNPKIVVNERLSLFEEEIEKRLGHKIKQPSLEDLTNIYLKSLELLSNEKKWPRKETKETFIKEAEEYFMDESLIKLDEFDGYPWHNLFSCLIDPGSMKKIPLGIGLACQWCFPSIFNYFTSPKTAVNNLVEDYIEKRNNFLEETLVKNSPKINEEKLKKSIILGGIFINTRYASKIKNGSDEYIEPYLVSIKKLLHLYEEINPRAAEKFRRAYSELGLIENKKGVKSLIA